MKRLFDYLRRYYRNTDKVIWLMCLLTSAFSVVMLMGIATSGYVQPRRVLVQIAAVLLGMGVMAVVSKIDYHTMGELWRFHYSLAYLLVLLTFVFGQARDDDQAWLPLPFGLTFQPSELLKISFIIVFALHLQKVRDSINQPTVLLGVAAHAAVPVLLIMAQGDDGTALVFLCIAAAMVFAAGLDFRYIFGALGAAVLALPIVWFFLMDDNKRMRVMIIFNPELATDTAGYQQYWGRVALGSGKLWGKGVFIGNHQYVPEMYNDFIFAFIGEALGFMGCLTAVVLLTVLCLRILSNGGAAKDLLGQYICVGIFGMLAAQTVLNIGMCLSVLPVIGLTLPLISGGGTSVVTTYLGLGVAMSVYMHSNKNLFINQ